MYNRGDKLILRDVAYFLVLRFGDERLPAFSIAILVIADKVDVGCGGGIADQRGYPQGSACGNECQGGSANFDLRAVLLRLLLHKRGGSSIQLLILGQAFVVGIRVAMLHAPVGQSIRFIPDFVERLYRGKRLINVGYYLRRQLAPFLRPYVLPIHNERWFHM